MKAGTNQRRGIPSALVSSQAEKRGRVDAEPAPAKVQLRAKAGAPTGRGRRAVPCGDLEFRTCPRSNRLTRLPTLRCSCAKAFLRT